MPDLCHSVCVAKTLPACLNQPVPSELEVVVSEDMWRIWPLASRPEGGVVARAALIRGPLAIDRVDRALSSLVTRHEALRMVLVDRAGHRWQVLAPPIPIRTTEFTASTPAEADVRIGVELSTQWNREAGPMLRACAVRIGDATVLALIAPRALCDEASMSLLWKEFAALYAGRPLPEPAPRYTDHLELRDKWLAGSAADEQRAYWQEQLSGELPVARSGIPAAEGVTEFTVTGEADEATLLAAVVATEYRFVREEQIVVVVPVDCRTQPGSEHLVGDCTNELALRVPVDGELPFSELVGRVTEVLSAARDHRELPIAEVLAERPDVFRTVVVPPRQAPDSLAAIAGLDIEEFPIRQAGTTATVRLRSAKDGYAGVIDRRAAHGWSQALQTLLADAVNRPAARIDELVMLPEADQLRRSASINTGYEVYSDLRPIHAAFAEQDPALIAIESGGESITYGELNARADALAAELADAGIGVECQVGIFADRSVDQIVALVGTWRAGAAMVPLDPRMPVNRVVAIAEDAGMAMILTQDAFRDRLAEVPVPLGIVPRAAGPRRTSRSPCRTRRTCTTRPEPPVCRRVSCSITARPPGGSSGWPGVTTSHPVTGSCTRRR